MPNFIPSIKLLQILILLAFGQKKNPSTFEAGSIPVSTIKKRIALSNLSRENGQIHVML